MVIHMYKKVSPLYVFEDKKCYKRITIFYKNKVNFVDTISRRTNFCDTADPCGSDNSHIIVQLNPDDDKYYLLTSYPTLMPPLKKQSAESIKAIARNRIYIYNQWVYTQDKIYKITSAHSSFRNSLQNCIQYITKAIH